MDNNQQSVKEVQAAMDAWAKALYDKNLEAMHKDYAKTYCLFDVKTTVNSAEGAKQLWVQCLPYFDKPKIEYKNMIIHASDDMAVVHFRNRITGTVHPMPEEMSNSWLRGTCCFRRIEGVWKCIHEHVSFPVDCETNQIAHEGV